jgi:hypothetical protein
MQKIIFDLPEYQNIHIELQLTFWTNKPNVIVNGNPVPHVPGNSRSFIITMPNGTQAKMDVKGFTFDYQPRILINGKLLTVMRKLQWYEWLPAVLPVALIFVGGAIGGLCAFVGVSLNFKMLRSNKDWFTKIVAVAGITAASFLGYALLHWLLTTIFHAFGK